MARAGGWEVSARDVSFRQTSFSESQSPINSAVLVPKRAVLLAACGVGIMLIWVQAK